MRTPFQRDRDRIVHATAFRRLNHKTQVFLYHEGDHYRSRLTHSLEVAQIARAIARLLGLDEDLAEALALAHDLGHPPFGHAGERALDRALADVGGFDHNAQSLAVVTRLERKYASFDGLNLSFETLEGLAKHNGPITGPAARENGSPALLAAIADAGLTAALDLNLHGSAEAQAAALADDIAWINHDIDDGLRAGLLMLQDLAEAPFAGSFVNDVLRRAPIDAERRRAFYEVNRRMITAMIAGAVEEAQRRLRALGTGQPGSVTAAAIRAAGHETVTFAAGMQAELAGLRRFLFARVYRHARVVRVMAGAEQIVEDLARHYRRRPEALPDDRVHRLPKSSEAARARAIGDFIAGMTDRFAIAEHKRLFPSTPELV